MISLTEATNHTEKKGDLLNKRKFANLLNDYVIFKREHVRHFRYDARAESTNYSKFYITRLFNAMNTSRS